jgi:hypothetical protein
VPCALLPRLFLSFHISSANCANAAWASPNV